MPEELGRTTGLHLRAKPHCQKASTQLKYWSPTTRYSHEAVTIGSGTKPPTGDQSQDTEVFITGTVVDALTGRGISDALISILDVAFESPDFLWNENQIYTQAITDENGQFSLPRGLPRGNFYTAYIMADGYITIVEDNFTILRDQTSPVDITAEMAKP